MAAGHMDILTGRSGTFTITTTAEKVVDAMVIVVDADTVFTSIKVGGVNVTTDYIDDAGATVVAGTVITPDDINKPFSAVKIASGQVTLVKR